HDPIQRAQAVKTLTDKQRRSKRHTRAPTMLRPETTPLPAEAPPAVRRGRRAAGVTLIEVLLATGILLLTSLSLAYAFSTTEVASRSAERAIVARASLQSVVQGVVDVAYDQLLSWNGVSIARGDHSVRVAATLVQVGLIRVECTVVDDASGA